MKPLLEMFLADAFSGWFICPASSQQVNKHCLILSNKQQLYLIAHLISILSQAIDQMSLANETMLLRKIVIKPMLTHLILKHYSM